MQRNQRPITAQVPIRLAPRPSARSVRESANDDDGRIVSELEEVFADPLFRSTPVARVELREAVESALMVDAINRLYRAHQALRGAPRGGDAERARPRPGRGCARRSTRSTGCASSIHEARNHFPEFDEAAEALASDLAATGHEPFFAIAERLHAVHGIRVRVMPVDVMPDSPRAATTTTAGSS